MPLEWPKFKLKVAVQFKNIKFEPLTFKRVSSIYTSAKHRFHVLSVSVRQLDQRKRRVCLCHLLQFARRFGRREVFLCRQNSFRIKRIYNLEGDGRRFEQPPRFPDHRNRVRRRRRLSFEVGQLESGWRDDRNLLLLRHFPREAPTRIAVLQRLQVTFELWLGGSRENRTLGSLPLEFWIKGPFGRRRVKRRTHLERGSVLTYHQISTTTYIKAKSECTAFAYF